jgi:hypothetical protein
MSTNVEELFLETPSCHRPSGGDIAGDFVLVEHAPDGRQESRELFGELWVVLSRRSKRDQLFADQVVECALRAKPALDPLLSLGTAPPRSSQPARGDYIARDTWPAIVRALLASPQEITGHMKMSRENVTSIIPASQITEIAQRFRATLTGRHRAHESFEIRAKILRKNTGNELAEREGFEPDSRCFRNLVMTRDFWV